MVFFTLFIVLPTEEICTLRRITSGSTVNDVKSRLELSAGLPSQIYHLSSRRHDKLGDDHVMEVHHNVWNGFLYRAELKDKWRALFEAVVKDDVGWLLRHGCVCMTSDDVDNASNKSVARLEVVERGCVALYLASWLGSNKICLSLLSAGVNPNGSTRNKRTPLFAAVARDNCQVVNILLNHRAKLYVKDCNGDTPVDIARRNSAKQCMKRILSAQNISIHSLATKDESPNTESDTSSSQVPDETCLENAALFPKHRPFTSHERSITVFDNALQVKPSTSFSRRSVRFSMEKGHSLRSRSDTTQLPDVHLHNAYVRSRNGAGRRHVTRIPELSEGTTLRAGNSLPESAAGKSWDEIKDVGTWTGPTTALELLYIRSLLRKQKSDTKSGHSDFDLETAKENKTSDVAKEIDLGSSAINFTIAENEQNNGVKNMGLDIPAPRLTTAQNEQSDVARNIDLDTPVLRPTTAHNEHSDNIKDIDCTIPAPNITAAETEQNGVAKKIDLVTSTLRHATVQNEESYNVMNKDCNTPTPNITTAETEHIYDAKEIAPGTPALKLTTAHIKQTEDPIDTNAHHANIKDGNVERTSNLHRDNKTNSSHNSVNDSRPTTAHCSAFRSKKLKCKSAGVLKTAARQIQLAEHRKRVKSASDKSQQTTVPQSKTNYHS